MYYIVYKTKNLITGQEYIGCHQTKNLNDGYLGSGKYIKRAVKRYGKENFFREILKYCASKDEMAFFEKIYVTEEYVKNPNTYNLQTGGLSNGILCNKSKKQISKSVKQAHKLGKYKNSQRKVGEYYHSNIIKEKISKSLKEKYKTENHHSLGNTPWNKGKSLDYPVWNKGKSVGSMPTETKSRISQTLKEKYKEQTHPKKGKPSWNSGIKTGISPPNKGKPAPTKTCIYCGICASVTNIKRWHDENCKLKVVLNGK